MANATGNLSIEAQARYRYVEELLTRDFRPPAKVVELGAAPGDQIARLADLGYAATSLDIGSSADGWGDGEAGRMRRLLLEHQVDAVWWDMERAPYPLETETFDAVIMTEVFEHLRDYPMRSLTEVRRILKPNGRLYFTTPNAAYLMNRAKGLAGHSTATSLPNWVAGVPHARHAREYTFAEIDELMRLAELNVVSMQSRHFHLDSGAHSGSLGRAAKIAIDRVARIRPTLGPQIIVVAEKRGTWTAPLTPAPWDQERTG